MESLRLITSELTGIVSRARADAVLPTLEAYLVLLKYLLYRFDSALFGHLFNMLSTRAAQDGQGVDNTL